MGNTARTALMVCGIGSVVLVLVAAVMSGVGARRPRSMMGLLSSSASDRDDETHSTKHEDRPTSSLDWQHDNPMGGEEGDALELTA